MRVGEPFAGPLRGAVCDLQYLSLVTGLIANSIMPAPHTTHLGAWLAWKHFGHTIAPDARVLKLVIFAPHSPHAKQSGWYNRPLMDVPAPTTGAAQTVHLGASTDSKQPRQNGSPSLATDGGPPGPRFTLQCVQLKCSTCQDLSSACKTRPDPRGALQPASKRRAITQRG